MQHRARRFLARRLAACPGLPPLGATGAVSSGSHAVAQQWSRAIHDHPAAPNGISYRSNHDNSELCIAFFDRASHHLVPGLSQSILADRDRLAVLLDRYNASLD
ncbi:RES domain-containing protein [Agrobacterium tumefaciens]|nr:RES domain-containing protein [Agrobacterium tumefaciens]